MAVALITALAAAAVAVGTGAQPAAAAGPDYLGLVANGTTLSPPTPIQIHITSGPLISVEGPSGESALVPAGTAVVARSWTVSEYDTGRPTDGSATIEHQVTKEDAGAQLRRPVDAVWGRRTRRPTDGSPRLGRRAARWARPAAPATRSAPVLPAA